MHSALISKVEKARRYAAEPERLQILELQARFHGSNREHLVTMVNSQFHCTSSFFESHGTSSHIMAIQKMLAPMLTQEQRVANTWSGPMTSAVISQIEKARRYAEEPERVQLLSLQASFCGDHGTHVIRYAEHEFSCTCEFFMTHQTCAHVMAAERLLQPMLGDSRLALERTLAFVAD
jgi:hypothetical protein